MRPDLPRGTKLTRAHVTEWAARAAAERDVLDLTGYDLRGINLGKLHLSDVIFGFHNRLPPAIPPRPDAVPTSGPEAAWDPATLRRASFRESTLDRCFFAHCDLTDVDLRGCTITRCDMRYARFHRTTLENSKLVRCDLYRATVREGSVMQGTTFELTSLTESLEGVTGLRWEAFKGRCRRPALATEGNEEEYRKFLQDTKLDRLETDSIDDALGNRFRDAARAYRNLSGVWSLRGQFRDAGRAYVHSRRLERRAASPLSKGSPTRLHAWLGLWSADMLCSFGESFVRLIPWLVAIALLPGFAYAIFGGVDNAHGVWDHLLFSTFALTGSIPHDMTPSHIVELITALQRMAGIALFGLFGFVLANRIRSS